MKKLLIAMICLMTCCFSLMAASYTDNVFQKLAREYSLKSEQAFDAGEYDAAVEYSLKAEENAGLSEAYSIMMISKYEANTRIKYAQNQMNWAKRIHADVYYPMAWSAANVSMDNANNRYASEDYISAKNFADEVLTALAGVKEVVPLPEYYVVKPWAETKDCYWNIAGRPYVYNNPLLWENLYESNKDNMSDPANPDLIHPGMKMLIPSISGEFREGVYSPSVKYEPYSANR